MIEMDDRGPPLTADELESAEKILGTRLPETYRSFLLEINGGYPSERNVGFPLRSGGSTLNFFYGIGMEDEWDDLVFFTQIARERHNMPETLVPIAVDDGGEFICLGVAGDEIGKVYFRENDRVPDDPNPKPWARMKGYVRIADSFSEFLASLAPLDS